MKHLAVGKRWEMKLAGWFWARQLMLISDPIWFASPASVFPTLWGQPASVVLPKQRAGLQLCPGEPCVSQRGVPSEFPKEMSGCCPWGTWGGPGPGDPAVLSTLGGPGRCGRPGQQRRGVSRRGWVVPVSLQRVAVGTISHGCQRARGRDAGCFRPGLPKAPGAAQGGSDLDCSLRVLLQYKSRRCSHLAFI